MNCSDCDLAQGCKTVNMPPDTSGLVNGRCDVMIIGEAPGHDEDLVGTPFVGASGSLLRTIVDDVGLDEFGLVYTNTVRCRPPNNASPQVRYVNRCKPKLIEEIERFDPKLVVLLGNTPLKAVLGETGITAWRGAKLERDGRTYIPSFHPAYILRNNNELPSLLADLQAAYDMLSGNDNQSLIDDYDITLVAGEADAKEMYEAIKAAGTVAWDTESRDARPYANGARMIMLSFAINKPKRAWAVLPDNERVAGYCMALLRDPTLKIICHNAKYDQHVVWSEWGIEVPGIVGDSMIASWVIDSTPGRHGLKHLAGRLLSLYEYNHELDQYHQDNPKSDPSKGGDQALVPVDVLAPYAAIDAIATLEIHRRLYKQMDTVQRTLYNQLLMPVSDVLWRMERSGVALDQHIVRRYIKAYGSIRDTQYDRMMNDPMVEKFVKFMQRKLDTAFQIKYAGKTTRARKPVFSFNPRSAPQMRALLFSQRFLGLEVLGKTKSGDPSTKWEYIKPFSHDNTFLQAYHYHALMSKMLSTYVGPAADAWLDADGRVRSTYNIHGTVSGRLSSSDPNLQNIPTPEKEPDTVLAILPVKNIFTASDWGDPGPELTAQYSDLLGPYVSKGGLVMVADYSAMELRTMASVSDCTYMLDIFRSGGDVHRIVSAGIFGVPEDMVTKEMRYAGKWTNWTLLYGGNEHVLRRLYDIPLATGKKFVSAYYEMFPEILDYQKEIIEFAHDNGYVESRIGQRRYLPYINDKDQARRTHSEREALNHPIQSVASQMLLMVLIILGDVMKWYDLASKMVNTVHDQVMTDTPLYEVPLMAGLIKQTMEGLITTGPSWFPDIDLSWFTCPLKAEIEVGSHYGTLTEYHVPDGFEPDFRIST